MKRSSAARVATLFFVLCLPANGEPSATNGPFKFFHNKHPERSNPHYKEGMHHKHTSSVHHTSKTKRS